MSQHLDPQVSQAGLNTMEQNRFASAASNLVGRSSKYTIVQNAQYQQSRIVKRGGMYWVNIIVQVVTPQDTSAWEHVCDLPTSSCFTTMNPPPSNGGVSLLVQSGHLYMQGGTAGTLASVSFCYPE